MGERSGPAEALGGGSAARHRTRAANRGRAAVVVAVLALAVVGALAMPSRAAPGAPSPATVPSQVVPTAAAAIAAAQETPPVFRVPVTGVIDPLVADAVERAIARAEREHAGLIVLELNTPGGLDTSMRKIITAMLGSSIPVAGWVGPEGARAASAGTFIIAATSYAAMAPNTTIGAAHPVGISGEVLEEKVTNDAAAYIRELATSHGRNADWYERAVRESVSIGAQEAVRINVVESIQEDLPSLLAELDGKRLVSGTGQEVLVRTQGAPVRTAGIGPAAALLHDLVDPNVAFLLFLLGVAGIVYEIVHPGIGVGGVAGALSLIVALLMFQALPVQLGGLALIVLGVGLFVLDLKLAGHAFLSVFGVIALVLGGLLLYQPGSTASVHPLVLVVVVAAVTVLFVVVARKVMAARRSPPVTGTDALIGVTGTVVRALRPTGRVRAAGVVWRARARDGVTVPAGAEVVVVGLDGLTLEVEPAAPDVSDSEPPAADQPGQRPQQ